MSPPTVPTQCIRNQARASRLAGRPSLQRYDDLDSHSFVTKDEFERLYEEKWDGAAWLDGRGKRDGDVIVLDTTPALSCASVSPASSPESSRRSTLDR